MKKRNTTQRKIPWNLSFSLHADQPPTYSTKFMLYIMLNLYVSLYTLFVMTRVFTNSPKIEFSLKNIQNLMEKAARNSDKNFSRPPFS